MTDQDFINILPIEKQILIADMRAAFKGNTLRTAAILLQGQVIKTDFIVAMIWQQYNDVRIAVTQVNDLEISTVFFA